MARQIKPATVIDRLIKARLDGADGALPDDETSMKQLPTLWDLLTRREAGDDKLMQPGSVTIRLGLGEWIVSVSSPALEVAGDCVVPTLAQALVAVEAAMQSSSFAWKPYKDSQGKFRKKPGKDT